jgi:glycine/D-amino acid oxidase-like deaminating enzyme
MLEGMDARVHALWARRRMEKLFPQLKGIGFQKSWYGMIGMTDDHLPRFHQLDENIFGFSGYNGRGIAPGTVFGRVLADFATDRISAAELPLPVTEPRPQKLRNIQEAGIRHGASALHLMRSFI